MYCANVTVEMHQEYHCGLTYIVIIIFEFEVFFVFLLKRLGIKYVRKKSLQYFVCLLTVKEWFINVLNKIVNSCELIKL